MAASPAQIAANRRNAQLSTGPKTDAGKEAARRNALKHGMTGAGVVIPGEDEHEVAIRVAALEAELEPENTVVAGMLLRLMAIASIRTERAYRHETALTAERMRQAKEAYDDGRKLLAEGVLAEMPLDPATCRRRLMTAPEGIDLLVGRLRVLQEKAAPRNCILWDEAEGTELDHLLGNRHDGGSLSRVALLTRGIVYEQWMGLDPAQFAGMTDEARLLWAVEQIHTIIQTEITQLEAHRLTLDPARVAKGRGEADERSILDLGKEGLALRRYAGAAERTMLKVLKELRIMRYEARCAALPPAEVGEALTAMVTELPALQEVRDDLGSFSPRSLAHPRRESNAVIESIVNDLNSSYIPIAAGLAPRRSTPTGP